MNRDRFTLPAPVGAASLFVIFASLLLTVFCLLSLTTADAERRMAETAALSAAEYYEADCEAERIFAELRAGNLPEGVTAKDGRYFYTCPISDVLSLHVELLRTESGWSILAWRAVSEKR